MKEFLSYLKPYKRDAVLAVFCIEAETVFELIIPLVMASIVDVGVATGDRHYILMKGLQMVLFALISLVLGQGSAMFSARCGQGLGAEIRKAEFAKLQQFSFANTDHFSSSSLVTRLTSDVTTIQNSVATGMRPLPFTSIRSWHWCFWWLPLFWVCCCFSSSAMCAPCTV